jgi:hypothetical protein
MFLSLDAQELTLSGDAKQLSKAHHASPALVSNAKKWLHSCSVAQRLMEANGSSDLFNEQPLKIRIQSDTPFNLFEPSSKSIAEMSVRAMTQTVIHASELISKIMGPNISMPQILSDYVERNSTNPHVQLEPFKTQVQPTGGQLEARQTIEATVILPEHTMVLSPRFGMPSQFPNWNSDEIAQFITLHEAGHAAHLGTHFGQADLYGYRTAAQPVMTAMSLLGISNSEKSTFTDLCETIFREIYADAFAALAMGAMSKNKTLHAIDEIMSFRQANQPQNLSDYGNVNGDATHDTREGMMALRACVEALDAMPQGSAIVHQTCIQAAQIGILRWAMSIAHQPSGSTGLSFWKHAKSVLDRPENNEAKTAYAQQYETIVNAGQKDPFFCTLCLNVADTPDKSKSFMAFGISLLMNMREHCGAPRVDLRGSKPESSGLRTLLDKIALRRDIQNETTKPTVPPAFAKGANSP